MKPMMYANTPNSMPIAKNKLNKIIICRTILHQLVEINNLFDPIGLVFDLVGIVLMQLWLIVRLSVAY